jgi:hypothetical protein
MNADYRTGQPADHWPRRGRWSPDELPGWYLELLGDLAGSLTAWRDEHDPPQRLDPRCDPRGPRGQQVERRAIR